MRIFPKSEDYLTSYYKFEINFYYSDVVRTEDYFSFDKLFFSIFLFLGWLTETTIFVFCKPNPKLKPRFV